MILGVPHGTAALCPHDDEWQIHASVMIARLENQVRGIKVDIRHVGSTSVPLIAANPVIDIALGVQNENEMEMVCSALCGDGFAEDNEHVSFARVFYLERDGLRTYQVFVVHIGSVGWRRLITFRDNLNADYELAQEYEGNNLAHSELSFEQYLKSKNDMIESVLMRVRS